MILNAERFLALTAGMALGLGCAHQAPPASDAPATTQTNVVSVPTPESMQTGDGEELVAVVEDDANHVRDDEDVETSEDGPAEEYGMVGVLSGGPMLEGGLMGGTMSLGAGSGKGVGVGGIGMGSSGVGSTAPQVRVGNLNAHGKLDPMIIHRIVRRQLTQIQRCYETELKRSSFNGKIVVAFVIGPKGNVTSASLSQRTKRANLDGCVQNAFKRLMFPSPGSAVKVSYPLIFQAP